MGGVALQRPAGVAAGKMPMQRQSRIQSDTVASGNTRGQVGIRAKHQVLLGRIMR